MYQIKYETKIVAFLDVLGFKRIVINDDNSILERYYTIIKTSYKIYRILKVKLNLSLLATQ